jgi:guanosine-3',5'-bis(diphosphate) 3'-pyrophosphohydrolase
MVEVRTTKAGRGPSRDWLNIHLGYVRTSHAREKIRQWFARRARTENIARGKELVEKEIKRLGLHLDAEDISRLLRFERLEDFYVSLGTGDMSMHQVLLRLGAQEQPRPLTATGAKHDATAKDLEVLGVGDLLTRLAHCCNPIPGDEVVGYITRTQGISIHRKDCHNILHEDEPERLISVNWGPGTSHAAVNIHAEAWDRVGLLRDISSLVSAEKVNIVESSTLVRSDHTVSLSLTIEVDGLLQLSRIINRIEGVRGVISVIRETGTGAAQRIAAS